MEQHLSRRDFLKTAGACVAGLACAGAWRARAAQSARRPNILFIFSDDHSIQTIGAYGRRLSDFCRQNQVTPNIDRLAAGGAVFQNSFCCNSLCSPSRAAVLTGLHSHANGVVNLNEPIAPGLWTYPVGLRAAGYQTAVFGKWHLASTMPEHDYWRILPGQGTYWNPQFIGPDGNESKTGYTTDIITGMSLDWLKGRDKNRPFFLAVQHKAPHRPWQPPTRYFRFLAGVKIPEPETLFDDYAGRTSPAHNQKMEIGRDMTMDSDLKVYEPGAEEAKLKALSEAGRAEWIAAFRPRNEAFLKAKLEGQALTRWKYQEYVKDYLRCIKAVDDSVGRLLDALEKEGLAKDTVVIYSSDQGFYMGEHGWFDKRWIYEESLHMPFIIRWPGVVQPGAKPEAMIQNIDYAETFVEIAGGQAPAGLHGRSLVPVLRGETPADWRKSIYYHYYDPGHGVPEQYGVRTTRNTLVHFPVTNEWELYDLEKDPLQLRSVYEDPAGKETLAGLRAELDRLRAQYKDDGSQPVKRKGKAKTEGQPKAKKRQGKKQKSPA